LISEINALIKYGDGITTAALVNVISLATLAVLATIIIFPLIKSASGFAPL